MLRTRAFPRIACRSSAGALTGMMLNLSTGALRTSAKTNAGRLGPSRMSFVPRYSRVNRMATASCSYQDNIIESGRSYTPHSNASASTRAI